MKKPVKYGLGGLALLVILVVGYLYWTQANKALPAPEALVAMRSDDRVTVEDGRFLMFRPAGVSPTTGLIFYPGAACDVRGYAPVLRRVAERGYLVVGCPNAAGHGDLCSEPRRRRPGRISGRKTLGDCRPFHGWSDGRALRPPASR